MSKKRFGESIGNRDRHARAFSNLHSLHPAIRLFESYRQGREGERVRNTHRFDGGRIFDVVLDDVGGRRYESGGDGMRKEERVRVVRVAQGDVAVGVHDLMVVEDVVCGDEVFEGRGGVLFGSHDYT